MKAGIIGLGVEGKKALISLIDNDWSVYAADSSTNVDFSDIELPIINITPLSNDANIGFAFDDVIIDLGFINEEEIDSCDAIVISPSLYGKPMVDKYSKENKLLCDVLSKHRDILTIGITGTNGKSTTVSMIYEILTNAGYNVLLGGNAGGGFNGYYDLVLKAENEDYDILLVEVCDMTLDFAKHCFDFDIVGLTNVGNDHMNVHRSLDNFRNQLDVFFDDIDNVFMNNEDYEAFNGVYSDFNLFSKYGGELNLIGDFNKLNAGLAYSITRSLGVSDDIISSTLREFKPVKGRIRRIRLNDCDIYIGKTDNSSAVRSLLDECDFYACFIGTPRRNEESRLDILDEVAGSYPEVIVLFEGLEDTIDDAKYRLDSIGYEGRVEVASDLDDIIGFVAEYSFEDSIFIGGNGQDKIIEIQERLDEISKSLNND